MSSWFNAYFKLGIGDRDNVNMFGDEFGSWTGAFIKLSKIDCTDGWERVFTNLGTGIVDISWCAGS